MAVERYELKLILTFRGIQWATSPCDIAPATSSYAVWRNSYVKHLNSIYVCNNADF